MSDKPDLIEMVRDLEKFAVSPTERELAKELGSLLFDHSTLKVENAKLKQDLHSYMMAANAEAELVDELTKENRTLVRQNGEWQAKVEADTAILRQALEALERGESALRFAAIAAIKERLK